MSKYEHLIKALLAFNADRGYIDDVIRQSEELKIEDYLDYGEILLHTGVHVVGKGQNSIVMMCRLAHHSNELVSKILRPDASRKDLIHEAEILRRVNQIGIGPRMVNNSTKIIVMEYVKGKPLHKFIREETNLQNIRTVIIEILEQAFKLDINGIQHSELSRLGEHILVTRDLKIYIIDFESGKIRSDPISKNVTQVVNALIMGKSSECEKVRKALNVDDKKIREIIELLREYKKEPSRNIFNRLIDVMLT